MMSRTTVRAARTTNRPPTRGPTDQAENHYCTENTMAKGARNTRGGGDDDEGKEYETDATQQRVKPPKLQPDLALALTPTPSPSPTLLET